MISVSVMAHRLREHFVADIQSKLGDIPVAWDEKADRWDTGRRAMLAHKDFDSQWSLVLQDDAVVPPRFLRGLEAAMANVPEDSPAVLYATRTRAWAPILDAVPRGVSYLTMERVWWGVGIVYPTAQVEAVVEECDEMVGPQYDHRVGWYYADRQIPVYYTWPNLLNHRSTASLVDGRSALRKAHNYSRRRADMIPWNGSVFKVTPPAEVKVPAR